MISYDEALCLLGAAARNAPARRLELPTADALDAVLASDVSGTEDIPLFDNSAMDGFAVCSRATAQAGGESPVTLPVVHTLAAGEDLPPGFAPSAASAVEIMTGAMMPPPPLDAVVRVEDVETVGSGSARAIRLRRPVGPGENLRRRGSDYRSGQLVARKGEKLGAAHVLAFAGLGIAKLPVQARPRVALVSTGKELLALGQPRRRESQIWNSTGPYLALRLKALGCELKELGTVGDCEEEFRSRLREAFRWGVDLVLSTGAVSMGRHDFVVEALRALGAELRFHKAAIRPGKPVCFAEFPREAGRPVFFGLPGNPVSTAVGLRFFVEPYLRELLGQPPERGIRARLREPFRKPEGLRCFVKARVRFDASGVSVRILEGQGSYVVRSYVEANCWAVLPEAACALEAGTEVTVFFSNELTGVDHD